MDKAERMLSFVAKWRSSGMTQKAFCQEVGNLLRLVTGYRAAVKGTKADLLSCCPRKAPV
jgi:hypothetical protein